MAMDRALRLETLGYSVEALPTLKHVPKGTWVNKDGVVMPNLPTDEYHRRRFEAKGFTLITQEK